MTTMFVDVSRDVLGVRELTTEAGRVRQMHSLKLGTPASD
jgi:hypothetical protein